MCLRSWAGTCSWSFGGDELVENSQLDRLNPALGHWPVSATSKLDCVVCSLRRKARSSESRKQA